MKIGKLQKIPSTTHIVVLTTCRHSKKKCTENFRSESENIQNKKNPNT